MDKLDLVKDSDIKEYLNVFTNYLNEFLDNVTLFAHCYASILLKYNIAVCKIEFKDVKPKGVIVSNRNSLKTSEISEIKKAFRTTDYIVLDDNSFVFTKSISRGLWDKITAKNDANDLIVKILRREI